MAYSKIWKIWEADIFQPKQKWKWSYTFSVEQHPTNSSWMYESKKCNPVEEFNFLWKFNLIYGFSLLIYFLLILHSGPIKFPEKKDAHATEFHQNLQMNHHQWSIMIIKCAFVKIDWTWNADMFIIKSIKLRIYEQWCCPSNKGRQRHLIKQRHIG